jgi:hypothetical protein
VKPTQTLTAAPVLVEDEAELTGEAFDEDNKASEITEPRRNRSPTETNSSRR